MAKKARKRGKLRGPKKAAFLKRMAAGRRKKRRSSGKATKRSRKRRRKSHASDWPGESGRHAHAARKGWRKRGRKRAKRKSSKRSSARRSSKSSKRSRAARKGWRKRKHAGKASVAAHYKSSVGAGEPRRRRRRSRKSSHRRRRSSSGRSYRRSGAMENPLNGVELFVGMLFGVTGFGLGDMTDRLIATHALTASAAATTTTAATYTDTPPTTGDYTGLYNPTAICAPMNMYRWMNAIGAPGLMFVVAHFIKAPTFRAAIQFTAFGYGVRTVGKGMVDLVAALAGPTALGQQIYDGELRAAALKTASGGTSAALTALPTAGLGRNGRQLGAGNTNCAPCAAKAVASGAGYPSMPRQVAPGATPPAPPPGAPTSMVTPTPPPAVIPPAGPPPTSTNVVPGASGVPRGLYAPWGGVAH